MLDAPPTSDWKNLKSIYQAAFFCSLGFFFVSFILPIVAYDILGASGFEVALIFSLLTLGSAAFAPVAGAVTKRGRRRESIAFGASVRAIAYIGMAVSILLAQLYLLIANSLLWGFGAAFYLVGSDAEISERVVRKNRAEAFGHRSAANARGSIIGTFIGFIIISMFDIPIVFIFFAIMNLYGGYVAVRVRPTMPDTSDSKEVSTMQKAIGLGIAALVIAAAIESFVLALLSPFVELYILEVFQLTFIDLPLVALVYLPSGIISAMLGGPIGKFADKSNQVAIVSGAALIVSVCTFLLAILPGYLITLANGAVYGLVTVGVLFTIEGVAGTAAFTVMSSVMGTAYEGRAGEGFGYFEAAMGLARFGGPLIGGLLWDIVNPVAPFIFVGFAELLLIPAYYYGMRQYNRALHTGDNLENDSPDSE
ncbi:MAG: MFS transporter [Candidatus Thorarchaeota archaeon]